MKSPCWSGIKQGLLSQNEVIMSQDHIESQKQDNAGKQVKPKFESKSGLIMACALVILVCLAILFLQACADDQYRHELEISKQAQIESLEVEHHAQSLYAYAQRGE